MPIRIRHNWQWNPDGTQDDDESWARLWIIVDYPNGVTRAGKWGDGSKWRDGSRWGLATSPQGVLGYLKRGIRQFRGSHTKVVQVTFLTSATSTLWGEGKKWGSGRKWGQSRSIRVQLRD